MSQTIFDMYRWQQFVVTQKIENITLEQYYDLAQLSGHAATERSMQYLFADFITLGVLQLPTGYTANDFEIKISPTELPYSGGPHAVEHATITKKSTNNNRLLTNYPARHIGPQWTLSSSNILGYAQDLKTALTDLLS